MKFVVILFILSYCYEAESGCTCGVENLKNRVIGGHAAQRNRYPWMVAVNSYKGNMIGRCGGSLINDRYILTAAHCFKDPIAMKNIEIVFGAHTTDESLNNDGSEVESLKVHEDYASSGGYNDIALIKLKKPVQFSGTMSPICLTSLKSGETMTLTGWGKQNRGRIIVRGSELYEVDMMERPDEKCYRYGRGFSPVLTICGGGNTVAAGSGDSGGPLSVRRSGNMYQVGIVSGGATEEQIVAGYDYPDLYERVSAHKDWIIKNTAGSNWCDAPNQLIRNQIGG